MAIDPNVETMMKIARAATMIPGGGVHIHTLRRWRDIGVGRDCVKLECILVGAHWQTSKEAIDRFIAARNSSVRVPTARPSGNELNQLIAALRVTRTPAQRRAGNEAAKHELRKLGLIDGIKGESKAERYRRLGLS